MRALQPTSVAFYEENYTLAKNVPAIQALMGHPEGDDAGLSLMTQLPAGAEIGIAGPGFNDRTVRVRCGGSWYYVFWDDLESQRKPAALAATL